MSNAKILWLRKLTMKHDCSIFSSSDVYIKMRKILNSTLLCNLISIDVKWRFYTLLHRHINSVINMRRYCKGSMLIFVDLFRTNLFETLKNPWFSLCFQLWFATYYQYFITIHSIYFYVTDSFPVSLQLL